MRAVTTGMVITDCCHTGIGTLSDSRRRWRNTNYAGKTE